VIVKFEVFTILPVPSSAALDESISVGPLLFLPPSLGCSGQKPAVWPWWLSWPLSARNFLAKGTLIFERNDVGFPSELVSEELWD
jgi:hypothetical protein